MRYLIYGAGAIGTYIGGSLALAGEDIVFIERPGAAEILRQKGLRLELNGDIKTVEAPRVVETIGAAMEQGPFDVAVLAVKSYDTEAVMKQLAEFRGDFPPVLCLQNGVENEGLIEKTLGVQRVIRGSVTTAVGKRGPGEIVVEKMRGIGIARGLHVCPEVAQSFTRAGLNAVLFDDGLAMKWSKMLTNLPANATSAILNWSAGQVYSHGGICAIEVAQLQEALVVMKALRLEVVDLPGTPVRILAALTRLPLVISRPLLKAGLGKGRGDKMPSFHIDLYSGSGRSEVDYLNGAVARLADEMGVQHFVNRRLTDLLLAITRGEIAREACANQPGRLYQYIFDGVMSNFH